MEETATDLPPVAARRDARAGTTAGPPEGRIDQESWRCTAELRPATCEVRVNRLWPNC